MTIEVSKIQTTSFTTSVKAEKICAELMPELGITHKYAMARLAIARSLSIKENPKTNKESKKSSVVRGTSLFGDGSTVTAWLALITQRSGEKDLDIPKLQLLVDQHWNRGAELLWQDWRGADNSVDKFISKLTELADFQEHDKDDDLRIKTVISSIRSKVVINVGEIAQDTKDKSTVTFELNATGGSPHMAIMGPAGTGKTRTAIHILNSIRTYGELPLLAFDFKGDLSESLSGSFDAGVIAPPNKSVPLNVLHVAGNSDSDIKAGAMKIRDSIASVKGTKASTKQTVFLAEAIETALRNASDKEQVSLKQVAELLESKYEETGQKPDELSALFTELTQFELFSRGAPHEFFQKSWIIQLPMDLTEELRRLIINLTLNALDSWLNSLPEATTNDEGIRSLRHITFIDEAHLIFRTKLLALGRLIRMSRSKGGVLFLASQSPDDFVGVDESYLDNMGLTLAFSNQAKPGQIKNIFGESHKQLSNLKIGEALCRIRTETKTRKILVWGDNSK